MKSNEEYLDELLKAMEPDGNKASFDESPQGSVPEEDTQTEKNTQIAEDTQEDNIQKEEEQEPAWEEEMPQAENEGEGFIQQRVQEEEEVQAAEVPAAPLPVAKPEELSDRMEEEKEALQGETQGAEPSQAGPKELAAGGEMAEDDLSPNSLEQLMAEIQQSSQNFDGIDFPEEDILSEESIDALLNEVNNSANTQDTQNIASVEEEKLSDSDWDNQDELSDIDALLNEADNNEAVDSEALPPEEEQIFSMEDLDSLLEDRSPNKAVQQEGKKKRGKKVKKASNDDSIQEVDDTQEKSGIGKFLSLLFEEEPDELDPEEAGNMNLSEENKEILSELDKEGARKKKVKPAKKGKEKSKKKKDEQNAEEGGTKKKVKKAPKPKKEKKPKQEENKEEQPQVQQKPEKRLPKKRVITTTIFAASLLAAILLLEFLIPPIFTLTTARNAYDQEEYKTAYQEFYGESRGEGDEERFQSSRAIMKMQTNLDSYNSFLKIGDEVKALHYLIEGVHVKDDVYALAGSYGATAEVDQVYMEILATLSADYGLTEEDAYALIEEKSDLVYTKKLQAIVSGTEYVDDSAVSKEISQEDRLPEEEEMFQTVMEEEALQTEAEEEPAMPSEEEIVPQTEEDEQILQITAE